MSAATKRVALIDAGGANLGSVRYALEREGAAVDVIRDADGLRGASRAILPGVGAALPAMALMRERGFAEALPALPVPLLGICLGMQLLFERSEEGSVQCLGLLPGTVRRLSPAPGIRVPHMGWNRLQALRGDTLLQDIGAEAQAYFVHGYAVPVSEDCIATATHGTRFGAVVRRGRVMGAQFHPERSAAVGAALLRNFLEVEA